MNFSEPSEMIPLCKIKKKDAFCMCLGKELPAVSNKVCSKFPQKLGYVGDISGH